PVNPGHTLVIPKKHCKDILDFPCELAPAVCAAVQKIAGALISATGAKGVNVLQNNGIAAGQSVFHIHWHIIPRYEGDGLELWHQSPYPSPEAMREMAAKLSLAVQK
ncbi:MAG: HIT family protein, partial [Mailhella sp.]|nr:HIT family protein [Mailhella sp.]